MTPREDTLSDDGYIEVNSTDEIPVGMTEDEEHAFWATHSFGPGLLAQARPAREVDPDLPPPRAKSSLISIRLEADTLYRLRALAARKGSAYQTLLKSFVVERLYEEEKREGLV